MRRSDLHGPDHLQLRARCGECGQAQQQNRRGFARMAIDGHLPRWGVTSDEIERRGEQAIDLFLAGITT
jgi:hypothetical protein